MKTEHWAGLLSDALPEGKATAFLMMDVVQKKNADDDPLDLFRERLRLFFGKKSLKVKDRLWFEWAGRWTFCVAKEPEDPGERARGVMHIYRAVYEKAK